MAWQTSLLVGLWLVLMASPSRAQLAPSRPPASQPDEQKEAVESEEDPTYQTVVRGKRPPRSASDWTIALGARRAAPAAGGSAAELLPLAPGVHISQHSGEGKAHQIFLRGFDAAHGKDVQIHAGGIPVNDVSNVHGQGYADLHFLAPEAVLRMRVLAGAYDPRQGDFAVAGSMDFDLGLSRRGLLARVSAGQHGLVRTLVAWGPRGQPDETFLVADLARGDGFGPARAWRRASVLGQALIRLTDDLRLRLLAGSYAGRFDSAGVLRQDDYEAGRKGFFDAGAPHQGGDAGRHQALVEVLFRRAATRADLSFFVALRDMLLRSNFTGYLHRPVEIEATAGSGEPQGDLNEQTHEAVVLGGQARYRRLARILGREHSLEAGVIWRHDRVDQAQRRLRAVDRQVWDEEVRAAVQVTDIGLYGDLRLDLHRLVKLRAGLRADALAFHVEDHLEASAVDGAGGRREAFGYHVGPRATLEVRPCRALRLFASYGNGFRSPHALSLGQGESAPFTSVHAAEVGGWVRLGSRVRGTLSGFVTHVAEDLVFDHASGRTVATGATTRGGVTLLVQATPLPWLRGTLGGTWVRAVLDHTGEVLPYAPPLVLRLDLDGERRMTSIRGWPLLLFGGLGLSVIGPRPLPYGEQTDTVTLIDLGVGLALGAVSLSVEARNLADARYRDGEFVYASSFNKPSAATPATLVPARHFTAGRPLSLQGTITVSY